MKGRISLRQLLLAAVALFVFSEVGYADPLKITIPAPGVNTFVFQNDSTERALDFRVVLASLPPPPAIGGGTGGTPFPDAHFELPATGGGFLRVIYDGGPGIAAGGMYTHSFPDWAVGAMFNVSFSYAGGVLRDPKVIEVNTSKGEGQTTPTPEPTTLFLLSAGLAGVAVKTRKRLKSR